jgi:hypothetical protein
MAHRTIENEGDLIDLGRFFGNLGYPFTVEWTKGRDRSRDQNALQWLWATEAAHQFGDQTAADVQRDWKLRHGVPILREDSAEFREIYDTMIKPLPFPMKLAVMDLIEVSSRMKVRQMVRYLDAIERECLANGLMLTAPDPSLSKYQARYRMKEAA